MTRIGSILTLCLVLCGCGRHIGDPVPSSCGVCGGNVVPISSVADDRIKPSRNISVWNRSICANPFYRDSDVICTKCAHAYSTMLKAWSLALQDSGGFQKPLHVSILDFPLPSSSNVTFGIVYRQTLAASNRTDSVSFWCLDDEQYLAIIQRYSGSSGLSLRETKGNGRLTNQVHVLAEHKMRSNKTPGN